MPTNFLRNVLKPEQGPSDKDMARARRAATKGPRTIEITAGGVTLRARLLDTPTAERLWVALPLFATAETWGEAVHFELPLAMGRDRTARMNGKPGEIYYWSDDDRVLIAYGPTPISSPNEIRLPRPCNAFAVCLDDPSTLKDVHPGEKVSVTAAAPD